MRTGDRVGDGVGDGVGRLLQGISWQPSPVNVGPSMYGGWKIAGQVMHCPGYRLPTVPFRGSQKLFGPHAVSQPSVF